MRELTEGEIEYEKLLLTNNIQVLKALGGNAREFRKRLAHYNSSLITLLLADENDRETGSSAPQL